MSAKEFNAGGANVFVDGSQFPESARRDLLLSFRNRAINHKFHYDTYKQAAKWLAVHEAHSPARTDRQCLDVYDAAFDGAAGRVRAGAAHVVGLGCGGGQKDARLLELLRRRGRALSYVPCDASMPLVLEARSRALKLIAETSVHPMVFDLATARDLRRKLPPLAGQRFLTFFGMIPNFEPQIILPRLRDLLRREDLLLFSANLAPSLTEEAMRRILPQYDNPETLDWLMTLLRDAGVEPNDGRARFSIEEVPGRVALIRFVGRFTFSRSRNLRLYGETFAFRRGDTLRLFFSCRYTPNSLALWLKKYGVKIVEQWIAESQEEGVFLCARN